MMRAVVTDRGAASLLDVPGPEVLAKTGTAQYGTAGDLRNYAWMIAIQGDLVVAVFVADGDRGPTTACPLLDESGRPGTADVPRCRHESVAPADGHVMMTPAC